MRGVENLVGWKRDELKRRSDGRRGEEEQLQGSMAAQQPQRQTTCEAVSAR